MSKFPRLSVVLIGVCGGLCGTVLPCAPALAAAAEGAAEDSGVSGSLQEVVVTARKREEKLQDVPGTVTAITSDELKAGGIERIGDLRSQVTNLVLSKSQTDTINPVIRG